MTDESKSEQVPNNHVVAILDGSGEELAATRDLTSEGFDQVRVFHNDELTREIDAKGDNANPFGRLFKAIQDHLSEEPSYLAQYQEAARTGHGIVAVYVNDGNQAEAAKNVLERHGAHNVRFFGKLAVKDLTPATNPSTRSEESAEAESKP